MSIEVDQEVFAEIEEYISHETVIIVGASDPRAAGYGLLQAARRFSFVAEDGREVSVEEAEYGDLYTPNYVSDIRLAPRGPWLYVDCKGYVPPAMGERMIAILVEELERVGVSGRIEVPSLDELNEYVPAMYLFHGLKFSVIPFP
ncbi:hypothetical protein Psi02_76980 [Planotetraspora silvatica]|uniref:Uncharacterized protein n=1 Tax=Planotetraspora silvatica TaxID=234614 RepID=A0A8J3XSJ0_9ACTN|nr:hypothetical protein [Planotetraspora silvatica]GII51274.1 hypothetical protein Psi02_76980 [Planotetraspora silvatica]